MALTEDAKAELREAIAIVREDRIDRLIRTRLSTPTKDPDPLLDPNDPPKDPPTDPPNPVDPPPKKDPINPPNPDSPKPRRSAYWGELMD